MNILHVITSLQTGGAEHLLVDLLPRLGKMGHNIELCIFYGKKTPFYKQLESQGIIIHTFSNSPNYYNITNIFRLRSLMKKFDIVHTHNTAPQLFAAICRPKGVKLITTEHSTSNRRRNYKFFIFLDKWMYRRYDKIICISDISKKCLNDYIGYNYPIITIENGIDVDLFSNASAIDLGFGNNILITMVAGFRYEKDQPTLIKSLNFLPDEYHVVLVGDGDKREFIENLISKLNLNNRVHLLGNRTDVPQILKASDIIVISSHREGLSLSNVEGMASGKPFVASDVDGLREVTKDAGVLFPQGDYKKLSEIIINLTTNKEYHDEVVAKCQKRAFRYNISTMVNEYNNLYSK